MNSRQLNRLVEYLRISSVANTDGASAAQIWLCKWLASFCDSVQTVGEVNSLIRASIKGGTDKTLCIYGHYDVQPALQSDGWETDPFEPVVTESAIIARGACDNKGQNFAFLCALESMVRAKKTPRYNVLILLEGEEEVGSLHLKEYLLEDRAANLADYYLLADGTSPYSNRPALYTGSLGVVFGEITVDNQRGDLHSGIFGNEVVQPAMVLASIIQGLYNNELPLDFKKAEQWSFSVNYLSAGSSTTKSIIPGRAAATISYRFSAGLEPGQIIAALQTYITGKAATYGTHIAFHEKVVTGATASKPGYLFKECVAALKKTGLEHFTGRLQGSLPAASILHDVYNADPLILSFGSKDANTHGINEHIEKASIERSIAFYKQLLS